MDLKFYHHTLLTNKNIVISILLSFEYLLLSFFILNDYNLLFCSIPLIFLLLILKITWEHSHQVLSSIFLFFMVLVTVVFVKNSTKTKIQRDVQILYNIMQFEEDWSNNLDKYITNNSFKNDQLNIYFIETNPHLNYFTTKQLCSIESAAKNNPKFNIYILSIRAKEYENMTSLSKRYNNVRFAKFVPVNLFKNTPLHDWWLNKADMFKSPYMIAHISDAARLALLYKYGGVYSDLDTITIKSFENLLKYNGFGHMTENNESSLGNGVIVFRSGHPYLYYAMKFFSDNYNPYDWGFNGPVLIIKTLKEYCNTRNIFDLLNWDQNQTRKNFASNNSKCSDLVIFPENYFYPFNYKTNYGTLFSKNMPLNVTKFSKTYSVHFYGFVSKNLVVKSNENSIYEQLAWSNCRETYDFITEYSLVFT